MKAKMAATPIRRLASSLGVLIALSACSADHDQGHGHAHDENGHEQRPSLVYTEYADNSELFVEFPALVAGMDSQFAAHVTRLSDYGPVQEGILDVRLMRDGETHARFRIGAPTRPGVFTPVVHPRDAGVYSLNVTVETPELTATYDLGQITVHATPDAVEGDSSESGGTISFLKEKQWQAEFGTDVIAERHLEATVFATAELQPPGDRTARVRAPAEGHFSAYGDRYPVVGAEVKQGERIGTLRARLGSGVDLASLRLAVERANARLRLAREDVARLSGLLEDGAIAAHRVREARNEASIARAERDAARSRLEQYQGGDQDSGVPLVAPISGRIVEVSVVPGEAVGSDQVLMHIAASDKRWLRTRIPEADANRLQQPSGAWFELNGKRKELRVDRNARLITSGGVIDPVSRTVPVIFEFDADDATPLVGQGLDAHVYTGERVKSLAVPRGAIIEDDGQPVVYIQRGGESFERRPVTLGLRGVDYIAVHNGVESGDRVVVHGAYQVRLAAAAPAEAGHGHAH
ncbi:efflux RND transporter periplasmic adaptor subunit [Endozoicomonas sp. G2_2]|uniref:efflux RND transporter periplasmic adaptor subunit n=1 Tax=Endozoicomonas sp. G2_2 TaxID=2821092 RepID=UPI001ADD47DA|nr:efflux RND transporter periplasmic adaptor subunit [Endozoicomonas sp. G2_2]MBO9470815.1 efflux RND transporter periplasmic adaptor subunit [Endozoicomonas sp. G2_2]